MQSISQRVFAVVVSLVLPFSLCVPLAFASDVELSVAEPSVAEVSSVLDNGTVFDDGLLVYTVLDKDAKTVQIGAINSSGSYDRGNGFVDSNSDGAADYPDDHKATIPATVTHEGVTYSIVSIAESAFRAKNANLYVGEVDVQAPNLTVNKWAFGGAQNKTPFALQVSKGGGIKSVAVCAFNLTVMAELVYPEGADIVYTDSANLNGSAIASVVYPLSYNGVPYCNNTGVKTFVVKSPYADISGGDSVGYNSNWKEVCYYFWNDSSASQSFEANTNLQHYTTPRVMAVLSGEDYFPAAVAPEGSETYGCSQNVSFGISDGDVFTSTPEVTIACTDDKYGWTLDEGSDFTSVYYDVDGVELDAAPSAPGSYSVEFVGNDKTAWGTSPKFSFTIDPDISAATVEAGTTEFTYNGASQAPELTVTLNGKALTQGNQYNVNYDGTAADGTSYSSSVAPTNAGSYTATVYAKSPSVGLLKTVDFTIAPVELDSIAVANVEASADGTTPVVPAVTVIDADGRTVDEAAYSSLLTYNPSSLVNAGTYTATVKGDGDNVKGEVSTTFAIVSNGSKLTSVELEGVLAYTGSELTPVFKVMAGETQVAATDYTVSYAVKDAEGNTAALGENGKPLAAGSYTATIAAAGSTYAGSVTCDFTVAAAAETSAIVTINKAAYDYIPTADFYKNKYAANSEPAEDVTYRNEAIQPDVTVLVDGKTLVAGTDYDIVFLDTRENDGAGDGTTDDVVPSNLDAQQNVAAFKVVLKGNYSGELTSDDYKVTINRRAEHVVSHNGVKFSYAVDADGNAVITGLGMDITADTTDFSSAYESAWDKETITIPGTIADGDKTYTVTRVADRAFALPSKTGPSNGSSSRGDIFQNATKLVLEEGIVEVGTSAFNCSKMTELVLPAGLVTIHAHAFAQACTQVKDIVIPKSVEAIGVAAFGDNLASVKSETVSYEEGSHIDPARCFETYQFLGDDGTIRTATADDAAFDGGSATTGRVSASMTSVTLPASWTSNRKIALEYCNVSDIYVMADEIEQHYASTNGVQTFWGTSTLADVAVNIWGWDVKGTLLDGIDDLDVRNVSFKPFAVLGDGYTYKYGFDPEQPELGSNVEKTYAGNVALGEPVVTNDGSKVAVEWNLQTNFANSDFAWTPVEGTDFTVAYADAEGNAVETITAPGTYTATLTGNDTTCFGTATAQVAVPAAVIGSVAFAEAADDGSYTATYTGEAVEPAVKVLDANGSLLEADTEYAVAYEDNVAAGDAAKVVVTGKGLYEGSVATATFTIAKSEQVAAAEAALSALTADSSDEQVAAALAAYNELSEADQALVSDAAQAVAELYTAKTEAAAAAAASEDAAKAAEEAARQACEQAGVAYDETKTPAENVAAVAAAAQEVAKAAESAAQAAEQAAADSSAANARVAELEAQLEKLTKQTVKLTPAKKVVKRATVKKKAQTFTFSAGGCNTKLQVAKLTKAQKKAIKSVKVSGSTIKVKVKKGAKKGTYKIKVRAVASGLYKASAWKQMTVKVK